MTVDEIGRAPASTPLVSTPPAGSTRDEVPADANRLPADAVRLVDRSAAGQIVTLVPTHAELTLNQATDLLSASPPFVARLIELGELPADPHGRVRYGDVMAYKARSDAAVEEGMRELTQLSESLGLYE